jgi:membrane peptidoglycan carboxypeptidase
MAEAYATLANHGRHGTYTLVEKVMKDGKQEVELPERREHQAVSREAADTTTSVLRSVVQNGTATAAQAAGRPAAGKTGTAEEDTAAWFAGYTPDLATVVAVMGQDPKTAAHKPLYGAMGLARINGGGAPAEIWGQYTRNALKGEPVSDFDLQLQDGADVTAPPSGDTSDEPGDGDESASGEPDENSTGDQNGSGTETPGDSGSSTAPGDSGGTESDPPSTGGGTPTTGGASTEPGPTGGGDGGGGDDGGGDDSSNGGGTGPGPGGGDSSGAGGGDTDGAGTTAGIPVTPRRQ